MKPPRVLHFIESLGIGGAERTVQDLAMRLPAHGIATAVCCLRDGPLRAPLERAGVAVFCLGLRRRSIVLLPWFIADIARVLWRLTRLLRSHNIDILHAHIADAAMLALAAAHWCGVPLIVTFHGLGLLPTERRRGDPRTWLRRRLYRALARGAWRSIAVSPKVQQALCEDLGFEPAPLFYEYELIVASAMPDINPMNPKYRLFIDCWKRLPLPLASVVGPWLSRSLG